MYDGIEPLDIQIEVSVTEPDVEIALGEENPDVLISIDAEAPEIEMEISGGPPLPDYEGPYEVVSALRDEQTLPSEMRTTRRDILVRPIPIYEVDNPQGGTTVTIGN